ncbi:hypothetical protein C8Q76DRAFT_712861 [Earliella scabrosa]|nr:hypothetical protein C8Q76DRAFT_712861 [Earliella scabrosa]
MASTDSETVQDRDLTVSDQQPSLSLTDVDTDTLRSMGPLEAQDWLRSQAKYHEEYGRLLRTLSNTRAPIHRYLPPELIMEIFGRIDPEHRRELNLLHVCRIWRELLLKTAEFWVDMVRHPVDHLKLGSSSPETGHLPCFKLALVQSSPRNISLDITNFTTHSAHLLAPHSRRITSLTVQLRPADAQHLFDMMRDGMPRLHTLSIVHRRDPRLRTNDVATLSHNLWKELQSLQYSHDALPVLRDLHIPAMLVVPCLAVPSLRTLTVGCHKCGGCRIESGPHTLDTILPFLERCPQLETLQFLSATEPTPGRAHSRLDPAALPHLRQLGFTAGVLWVSELLSKLVFPSTTVMKLRTNYDRNTNTNIPRHLRALPSVHALDRLSIQFLMEHVQHKCVVQGWKAGAFQVELDASLPGFEGVVEDVAQVLGSPIVEDLRVWVPTSQVYAQLQMGANMVRLLASFPHLVRLRVRRECPDDLLIALGSRTSGGVICAGLANLVVHWRFASNATEAMLRATCELARLTLVKRAEFGSRLQKFVFRCEGARKLGPGVNAGAILNGLAVQLRDVVDEVVVGATEIEQAAKGPGQGQGGR